MDKKGIGFGMLIMIILALISGAIYFGWMILWKEQVKESGEGVACKLSVIEAASMLGKLQTKGLPRLSCPKITVEIEGDNKEDIMKGLLDLMIKTSNDFGISKIVSKEDGRYCRRRYHPITFVKKGLSISWQDFRKYVNENKPKNIKLNLQVSNEIIDTNGEYSILFIADYKKSWGTWAWNVIAPKWAEEKLESENEGVVFIISDKVSKLNCDHLV